MSGLGEDAQSVDVGFKHTSGADVDRSQLKQPFPLIDLR